MSMPPPPRAPLMLPRAPVLGWSSFRGGEAQALHQVSQLPHIAFTTSGRAALYQALLQLALPAGSTVLVPTYHCPTMVAPVLKAGMHPTYYGITAEGLPQLEAIDPGPARAIIVAQYFGLPRSLAAVRAWCDRHGIALIEDCAHSLFGQAGERPVGAWGDFATASISKFLPVSEAGVLASATRPLAALALAHCSAKAQVKGLVDVVELSTRHRRLPGLNAPLAQLFALKNRRHQQGSQAAAELQAMSIDDADAMMEGCDMDRIDQAPLWICRLLARSLPSGPVAARRRANFEHFARRFADTVGARPLFANPPATLAPYVFPLWVDDADRVYQGLRALAAPVFRWDRIWPGTPTLPGDHGAAWSRHVLQLLCHQDLGAGDVAIVADATLELLNP